MHKLSVTMASKKETCKKKNYSEAEIDVLLMEEQMRAKILGLIYKMLRRNHPTFDLRPFLKWS